MAPDTGRPLARVRWLRRAPSAGRGCKGPRLPRCQPRRQVVGRVTGRLELGAVKGDAVHVDLDHVGDVAVTVTVGARGTTIAALIVCLAFGTILLELESAFRSAGRGYAVCRVPQPRHDVTEGPGSRLVLRNRLPDLTAAAHGNETAALSLFEQPFCSGVQGAKVTLLRVRPLRRIAKSSGPTVGGQRIDRTRDLVAAKCNEERAGADTGGLSARRVVLGTLQEITVCHDGRVQTIVTGPRPLGDQAIP